jgi:hypothetical protein
MHRVAVSDSPRFNGHTHEWREMGPGLYQCRMCLAIARSPEQATVVIELVREPPPRRYPAQMEAQSA